MRSWVVPAGMTVAMALSALVSPALAATKIPPASVRHAESAPLTTVQVRRMVPLDNGLLLAKARLDDAEGVGPWVFAETITTELGIGSCGTWQVLEDGSRLWRLRISSPGALHLNLGFSRFELPAGAAMWVYDPGFAHVEGPYTAGNRSAHGRLFTPVIPGDEVVVELHVPAAVVADADLVVARVNHGFRGFDSAPETKVLQGDCNNDVVCPEGDPWRDQIRSVARYTIDGAWLCSGQLVNNTAEDDTPYFLSAYHCGVSEANEDSVVVYWNYEAPVCGLHSGGSLASNQSGSIFRASEQTSDFLLLELAQDPPEGFDVHFAGWDVSGDPVTQGSVCIHHPSGAVKSISFNDDPLGISSWILPDSHWMVDNWEDGTTEGGSSGSCLFDPASGLCVGVLTAGLASCSVIEFDIFGRLDFAWHDAGDSDSTRLAPWLDPTGSGVTMLTGKDPEGSAIGTCSPSPTTMCLGRRRFQVEAEWRSSDGTQSQATVAVSAAGTSGAFSFFEPGNWELLVKVLDGCSLNDRFWFFAAAATNVEYTVRVTDTVTGDVRSYGNPAHTLATAVTDAAAFATCHAGAEARAAGAGADSASLESSEALKAEHLKGPDASICLANHIECGDTVTGALEAADCDFSDGTLLDYWDFEAEAGVTVTIDMESTQFDAVLLLADPFGRLEVADDDGGEGTNARIVTTLDVSGTWTIVANSALPAEGAYQLSLQCGGGYTEPPAAPSQLEASAVSETSAYLRWHDNSDNEAGFTVEARTDATEFADVSTALRDATTAIVRDLEAGTRYTFRVLAHNSIGESAYSNEASVHLPLVQCARDDATLCLNEGRFKVQVQWQGGGGSKGMAGAGLAGSDASGIFSFFDPDNWEVLVKVIDGCPSNGHFWVLIAGATTLEYTVVVTDSFSGDSRQFSSPTGPDAPAIIDTEAFVSCERAAEPPAGPG